MTISCCLSSITSQMGLPRYAIEFGIPQEAFIPRQLDGSAGATAKVNINQILIMFGFLAIGTVVSIIVFLNELRIRYFVMPGDYVFETQDL